MSETHHKFDFIAILPHCGGRMAMENYLLQCGDVAYTHFRTGKSVEELIDWLDASPNQYLGLIVDFPTKPLPMEIVNLAVPKFPLLLVCRDIVGYLKTGLQYLLKVVADHSSGLLPSSHPDLIKSDSYDSFPADLIDKVIVNVPFFSYHAHWHKVFAALRVFAGPMAVVEFTELTMLGGGGIPEIMRRVGTALFNNPAAWNGLVVESHLGSVKNYLFTRLPKLRLTDVEGRFSCSLSPWPREFWEFMKRDATLAAACYQPETIGWHVGEFKGDLGFVCDEEEIAASGLPKEEFVRRAGVLVEADGRKQLREYTQAMNTGVVKADEWFAQVEVSPEQIIETIRRLGSSSLARYCEIIRSQAEELATVGVDVTERWTYARELLGSDGFSRPPEQRYSHLRELIGELLQQQIGPLKDNIDHLLAKHGRLAFWGLGNYFRLNVPSWLSDRPGIFLVDRVNRDSCGCKQGQSPEVLEKEKVGLIIISAAPDSDPYWQIVRDVAAGYPDAVMRSLGHLL
jgi:hypothetical protein